MKRILSGSPTLQKNSNCITFVEAHPAYFFCLYDAFGVRYVHQLTSHDASLRDAPDVCEIKGSHLRGHTLVTGTGCTNLISL